MISQISDVPRLRSRRTEVYSNNIHNNNKNSNDKSNNDSDNVTVLICLVFARKIWWSYVHVIQHSPLKGL